MTNDFSELIEYLDQKFSKIDERFSKIDERFSKIDERFSRIDNKLSGIDGRLFSLESKVEDLQETKADKEDVNNLLNAVDAYAKKSDTYFQEMTMLSHKVDRHERWFQQVAQKLDIKLEH